LIKDRSKLSFLVSWKQTTSYFDSVTLFLIESHFFDAFSPLTFQHKIDHCLFKLLLMIK
jgi:hypothetical protein